MAAPRKPSKPFSASDIKAIRLTYLPATSGTGPCAAARYRWAANVAVLCDLLPEFDPDAGEDDACDPDIAAAIQCWYDDARPGDLLDLAEQCPRVTLVCVQGRGQVQKLASYQRLEYRIDDID